MATIDLNAARIARAEVDGEPKSFTFGKPPRVFALPTECPMRVATMWAEGDFLGGLKRLLGETPYAEMEDLDPSVQDVEALAKALGDMYGGDSGESPASASSSSNGSSRSRRTSSASTG